VPLIDAPEAVWRPPVDNQAPPRVRWGEEGNDAPGLEPANRLLLATLGEGTPQEREVVIHPGFRKPDKVYWRTSLDPRWEVVDPWQVPELARAGAGGLPAFYSLSRVHEVEPAELLRPEERGGFAEGPIQTLDSRIDLEEGWCIEWSDEPQRITSFRPGGAYPEQCFAFNNTLYAGRDGFGSVLVAFFDGFESQSIQVWRFQPLMPVGGGLVTWLRWATVPTTSMTTSCPTLAARPAGGAHLVWTSDDGLFHVELAGAGAAPVLSGDPAKPVIAADDLDDDMAEMEARSENYHATYDTIDWSPLVGTSFPYRLAHTPLVLPAVRHDLHCDFVTVYDPLGSGFFDGTYRVGSYDSNYFYLERLTPAPGPPFGVPPETVPASFYRSRHLDVPSGFIDDRDCIHLFWAERECPADVAGSPDPTEQVALYYRKGCVQRCS